MTGQATALPTIPIDHLSATQRASAAQVRSGITSCRCTALNDTGTLLPLIPQLQTCPNRSGRLTLSASGRAVCRVSPEFVARDGAAMVWGVELLGAWPARTHHNRNQRFLLRLVLRRPIQFPKVCLTRRAFAGIGVLLAAVGLYGVMSFLVTQRRREIGVRMAIGATPRDLLVRVLREGSLIVATGIAAGAAGGFAFSAVAGTFVNNVRLPGALPLLGAAAVLVGAGILASLMPAAKASHVDVVKALRSE